MQKQTDKYALYKAAFQCALDAGEVGDVPLEVLEVGGGFGGIVTALLEVFGKNKRNIRITVVEKNQVAVTELQRKLQQNEGWQGKVKIVHVDAREWETTKTFDWLVSELLGGFGDNELSPECLKPVLKFLKPNAVQIPTSQTSFVLPVRCVALTWKLNQIDADDNPFDKYWVFQLPSTVTLKELAPPQAVWDFCSVTDNVADANEVASAAANKVRERMRVVSGSVVLVTQYNMQHITHATHNTCVVCVMCVVCVWCVWRVWFGVCGVCDVCVWYRRITVGGTPIHITHHTPLTTHHHTSHILATHALGRTRWKRRNVVSTSRS